MSTSWDDTEREDGDDTDEDDAGMIGGGGPAETADADADEELDRHGDNLARADEDELER